MVKRILTALLLAMVGAQTGCVSLFPKTPPAQLYRFGDDSAPGPAEARALAVGPARTRVVVEGVDFPHASTTDGILTVDGDKTAYIAGARWVSPARILFEEALERRIERSPALSLASLGDPGPPALLLRVRVTTFEVDMTASGPVVRTALQASLAEAVGGEIQTQEIAASAPAAASTQAAIVSAYDRAVEEVLTKTVAWGEGAAMRLAPTLQTTTTRVVTRSTSSSSASAPATAAPPSAVSAPTP